MDDEKNIEVSDSSIEELGETKMPYGKYKGKTFEEIYNDGDYLEWIAKQSDYRHVDVKAKVQQFLKLKEVAGCEKPSTLQDLAKAIVKRRNELKDSKARFKDPLSNGHWY